MLLAALPSPVLEAVLGGPSVRQAPIAERGTAPKRGRAGLSRSWSSRKEKSAQGPGERGMEDMEGAVSTGKVSTMN